MNTTAVRTYKGSKATITVTLADGSTVTRGGKIAERATCVLVSVDLGGRPFVYGFRADMQASIAETIRSGNPNFQAIAVTSDAERIAELVHSLTEGAK